MKQSTALHILKQGHSVFLTGQAGAGKTYVLNQYIRYLREHGIPVAITASTGIAATHMNGMTIHAWSGIGIKDSFEASDFRRLKDRKELVERLKSVKVLIIDEVSMLHAKQLDLVDEVLRYFRDSPKPFGGVQVIFSGDFFQLPPIGTKDETTKDKFAFMSKAWIALANTFVDGSPAIKICYLSEQHRQVETDDTGLTLNDILNQIRSQTVSQSAINTLLATANQPISDNHTRLYTHNTNVDKINQGELDKLDGKVHEFNALTFGEPALLETLKKNVRTPETLSLKKGAKVMFIKNNANENVYNGTLGEVVDFVKDSEGDWLPKVQLDDNRQLIVTHETWSIDDEDGSPLASFSQIPLCLAWAITIHKSQGMTLSSAEIDLSKTFEMGQGYVALSRVRSLDGLRLLGMNQKSLLLDEFAQVANRRFLVLSGECEAWFESLSDDDKQTACDTFLNQNAIPSLTLPKDTLDKTKPTKPKTTEPPSFEKTLSLVLEQKSLAEIAGSRNLAQSTIIEHIGKLIKSGQLQPDDIAYFAPDDEIINKVKTAVQTLQEQGEFADDTIKLRPIFDELRETVSFNEIRLALLFI